MSARVPLKGLLSPQWRALLRGALRHTITVIRQAPPDKYGKIQDGERVLVPCYIDGSNQRIKIPSGETIVINYTVDFPRDANIAVNDRVEAGSARSGDTLLEAGRIVSVTDANHVQFGRLVQTAQVVRA